MLFKDTVDSMSRLQVAGLQAEHVQHRPEWQAAQAGVCKEMEAQQCLPL